MVPKVSEVYGTWCLPAVQKCSALAGLAEYFFLLMLVCSYRFRWDFCAEVSPAAFADLWKLSGLYSGGFAMLITKKSFVFERFWVLDRQCKDGIPASRSQDILLWFLSLLGCAKSEAVRLVRCLSLQPWTEGETAVVSVVEKKENRNKSVVIFNISNQERRSKLSHGTALGRDGCVVLRSHPCACAHAVLIRT